MDRGEFIRRLYEAITQTTDGRIVTDVLGNGVQGVLISDVYATFVRSIAGVGASSRARSIMPFSTFKERLIEEWRAGAVQFTLPEAGILGVPMMDPASLARSAIGPERSGKWYGLDIQSARQGLAKLDQEELTAAKLRIRDILGRAPIRMSPEWQAQMEGYLKDRSRMRDLLRPGAARSPGGIESIVEFESYLRSKGEHALLKEVQDFMAARTKARKAARDPVGAQANLEQAQKDFEAFIANRNRVRDVLVLPAAVKAAPALSLPLTANDQFLDAMLRHQVYMLRLGEKTGAAVRDLLNKAEKDLAAKIRTMLDNNPTLDTRGLKRMNALLDFLRSSRAKTWDDVTEKMVTDLMTIANQQPGIVAGMLQTVSPVKLDFLLPTPEQIDAIVKTHPFEGRTLKEWASSLQQTEMRRMEDQIKIGMVQGEDSAAIARRIVGSWKLNGSDGITELSRRNAMAIARTAVNAIMNAVNRDFFENNAEKFKGERFVATLDSRTTPICRSLDGKIFKIGEGPIPPLHFGCRSIRVVTLDGEALGNRPSKPFTEDMLLQEFAADQEIDVPASRDELPRGYKGAFDKFMSKRVRELTGQVAADVNYEEWMRRQPVDFQDDVLGKTKAQLFRTGKISLEKFVDAQYHEVTLKDLAQVHADVFRAAGLNPEDFL